MHLDHWLTILEQVLVRHDGIPVCCLQVVKAIYAVQSPPPPLPCPLPAPQVDKDYLGQNTFLCLCQGFLLLLLSELDLAEQRIALSAEL